MYSNENRQKNQSESLFTKPVFVLNGDQDESEAKCSLVARQSFDGFFNCCDFAVRVSRPHQQRNKSVVAYRHTCRLVCAPGIQEKIYTAKGIKCKNIGPWGVMMELAPLVPLRDKVARD